MQKGKAVMKCKNNSDERLFNMKFNMFCI